MILEICAFNIQSCMTARKAGASRIELCADSFAGGTTPSHGLIEFALQHLSIPVFPMIRPRGGNFIYDADELAIMKKDILVCKELGCKGIATGVQLASGTIDKAALGQIVKWAFPMAVTCHKVFDQAPDAGEALEDLIDCGCTRVLTSGLQKTALEGAGILSALVTQAGSRIIVMPGGGIRSTNIADIATTTSAHEFHSSGILSRSTSYYADEDEVRNMVGAMRSKKV